MISCGAVLQNRGEIDGNNTIICEIARWENMMTGFKCASRMAAPERPPHRNEPPSPNSLSGLALHGHHAHLFVTFCKIVGSFVPSSLENRLPRDKSEETVLTRRDWQGSITTTSFKR
jgi:hypothetical protein